MELSLQVKGARMGGTQAFILSLEGGSQNQNINGKSPKKT